LEEVLDEMVTKTGQEGNVCMIGRTIIIPFYDCFDLVWSRLAEISVWGTKNETELILANDGSVDPKTYEMLERAKQLFPFFRVVGFEHNHGFASINNYASQYAQGGVLCFLSSDVKILKPFWRDILETGRMWSGGRLYTHDTGWNTFGGTIVPYLEGWMVACHKDEFENVGGWDERFDPHDYEDVDLSLKAQCAGYRLRQIEDGQLQHMGCGTIGRLKTVGERLDVTNRNRELFYDKWKEYFEH
jgi:GT2 family glycosyltransferase